jgi:hypothetical protein
VFTRQRKKVADGVQGKRKKRNIPVRYERKKKERKMKKNECG